MLIHATITVTGAQDALGACEARLPRQTRAEVALEAADVLLFLVRLCDKLGIDLAAACEKKLALNAKKYPVNKARGKAIKYTKL